MLKLVMGRIAPFVTGSGPWAQGVLKFCRKLGLIVMGFALGRLVMVLVGGWLGLGIGTAVVLLMCVWAWSGG